MCLEYNATWVYNKRMTKNELLNRVSYHTEKYWGMMCEIRPALVRFDPPKIILNGRIWATAGYATQQTREMNLSLKFMLFSKKHGKLMQGVILPHELAHHADFDLNGESDKKCGHGEKWAQIMVDFGLPADKFFPWEYKLPRNYSLKGII